MKKGFLGIDLGTTGTKSILFDENDNVLGRGYQSYGLITPFDKFYEQNAEDWYDAVVNTVKTATKDFDGEIEGISFSAQGGSFLLCDLDENGKIIPLTNALTWLDIRADKEAEELGEVYKKLTGKKLGAGSGLSRLLWLKKNCPNEFAKTKLVLSTSDYIYYKMTGKAVIDYTSAAMVGVFDNENLSWDERLLALVGMNSEQFPKIASAGELIGVCNQEFLSKTLLKGEIKVYCGVHDQFAASLGSNYFGDGDIIISTGTTWVVFGKNDNKVDGIFAGRKHPAGGYGYFISAISSGTVLEWEKNFFDTNYDQLNAEIEKIDFDSEIMVYPFISGNGDYRGTNNLKFSVQNMNYNHTKFDMLKATMEGVAFEIRQIIDEYVKGGFKVKNIIVTGGATRSSVWMKILSTVLGRKLYLSEQTDGCCLGAYSVAKKGASGEFVTFEFNGKTVEPNNDLMGKYTDKFKRYNEVLNKIR
ncbi:MAG: hypothetical protein E7373_00100 [Clostridiales bacterium]|nr:hypothetical protein [Clostridiales bacterium]